MRALMVCLLLFVTQRSFASCMGMEDLRPFPAGETLQRFGQINERDPVYHGSVPLTEEDFQFLVLKGIRTIVTLELLPHHVEAEQRLAAKYGIVLKLAPMQASVLPPSESSVNLALSYVFDRTLWPLYFHCQLGRDRTMLVAGLYMNKFLNKSEDVAYAEMRKYGFDGNWVKGVPRFWLHGLHQYFFSHTVNPIIIDPVAESYDPNKVSPKVARARSEAKQQ